MRFSEPWEACRTHAGQIVWRPVVSVLFPETGEAAPHSLLVDTGGDVSLAPRELCEEMGKHWDDGVRRVLSGISPKEECAVESRVHDTEICFPQSDATLTVPIAFAEGYAPLLLGRDGIFESFRITLDRPGLMTHLRFVGEIR